MKRIKIGSFRENNNVGFLLEDCKDLMILSFKIWEKIDLFTQDFRRNVIRRTKLCILIYIVLWIQSLIFTHLMLSRDCKLKLKTSCSLVFRNL